MKEVILITGAGGLVAGRLFERLKSDYDIRLLTRRKKHENEFEWDVAQGTIDENALKGVHHI